MAVLSQLRARITRLRDVFTGILVLLVFGLLSVSTVSGFLLYQILRPARTPANFDLNVMMGHPTAFSFSAGDGATREGWFFPGLRRAPTVIVCHGYLSQRADVLTLVTALQDHQYNVFLFDFTGHGTSPGVTTLGYRETAELMSAMRALATRDDVDPQAFGLWGVDMGGYTALEVAAADKRIAALAVDDVYSDPRDLVRIEIQKSGLNALPFVLRFADFGFRMINYSFRHTPPVSAVLGRTNGTPKLFIQSDDRPALAGETLRLFIQAPEPKQTARHRLSYRDMSDEERKDYESQIVNFFLQTMPPLARP
jgi:pimeloyl-ACP methyl ester carboxylesterase